MGLETLERRVVLAAPYDLAAVGLISDGDGLTPIAAELEWGVDRGVSGTEFLPGTNGPDGSSVEPFHWINGPGGLLRTAEDGSVNPLSIGSRFLGADGYPAGWGIDSVEDDSEATFFSIVERPAAATGADLAGIYSWNFTHITDAGDFTRHGLVEINGVAGIFAAAFGALNDPFFPGETFEISSVGPAGKFEYATGNGDTGVIYLSADFSTLMVVDLDAGDGDTWVGIGVRQSTDFTAEELAGSYRLGAIADGPFTTALFGARTAALRLDLDAAGGYEIFSLASSDEGDQGASLSAGVWSSDNGLITIRDGSTGDEHSFKFSENGSTLLYMQIRSLAENAFERPLGIATRIEPDGAVDHDTTVASAVFDSDGNSRVFDLSESTDGWTVADLAIFAFGTPLGDNPADLEAFTASDGTLNAVVTTDDGLFAFARGEDGFWRGANLSDVLSGPGIESTVTVFTDLNGRSHVGGVTGDGDVVTYVLDPSSSANGGWSFLNITESHLDPKGQNTPVFVGGLISYVTRWNGLNIAGLDAEGNIKAVWSGNGGADWNASNLSTITGAPAMASGLTAYLTSWGGINIVGLDSGGRMLATWWVPAFGGDWRTSNLTAIAEGPTLTGESLTSFVAPWGGLNIAGLNSRGDVIAYWWSPATEEDGLGWEVANLTGSIPDSEPRPTEQLHSQTNTSHRGEMNVLGTDQETGDLIRLFFRVETGTWSVENVSQEAQSI